MEKFLLLLLLIFHFSTQATRNKVEELFGDLYSGEIYSGYLKTKIDGNELFYMYAPSQNNQETDPVLLWLNGGPGCSSLFGFLAEVGPVTTDNFENEFKKNPYSWNTNANLLVIEQPAGVGFSKTSNIKYPWNDNDTAENLLIALKDFLNEYNLKDRDFYISGESYAGIYIPFLVTHILKDTSSDKINVKGIIIGNGVTDFKTDLDKSMVEFGFYRGIISLETYNAFKRNCLHEPDELYPEEEAENDELKMIIIKRNVTSKCNHYRKIIRDYFKGNDIYGIYRLCPDVSRLNLNDPSGGQFTMKKTILEKMKEIKKIGKNNGEKTNLNQLEPELDIWPDSCGDDLTIDRFLNNETVKSKLAIYNQTMNWTQCANLDYNMSESFYFYNETMREHPEIRVWLFSGTEDAVIPTLGTMRWIKKLHLSVETKWRQYKIGNQVGGYVQKYGNGLVIVTAKGAGHMVPQDQRAVAYKIISSFFKGELPE